MKDTTQRTKTLDPGSGLSTLAGAGVEFTTPHRGDKQPFTKGWPLYRPGLAVVAQHLALGHNLGIHAKGYPDGRILAYFDADDGPGMAALLRVTPELANSLQSWRESGSGKIFFWTSPDGLSQQTTPDLDGPHTKREFKVSGQAAIFGIHPSGESYETNWAAPITLTPERVKAIWDAWTGQAWVEGRKRTKAEPGKGYTRTDGGDVDKVKAAWPPSKVFAHHLPGVEIVKDRGGELRVLGKGGLLCNDDDGLWHSFAENTGGDAIDAWAWATGRDSVRDFPAIMQEMAAAAGIELTPRQTRKDGDPDSGDTDTDTDEQGGAVGNGTLGTINRARLRLRSVDLDGLVPEYHPTETNKDGSPLRLKSRTGHRTGDRDRVVADAALGYLWEFPKTFPLVRISNLELSERTGYSPNGCGAAMKRLVNIFQPIDDGTVGKQATLYKLTNALLCDTVPTVLDVSQSSALPLATHRKHDVFVRSLSAITPEIVAERNEKRRADGVKPMRDNRQLRARLAASARALGPAALLTVDILAQYGALRGAHLAALLHKSKTATRRIVSRMIAAGLVVEDGGAFDLAPGWSERVDELDAIVPTAGTMARRALAAADSRLRYCEEAEKTTVDYSKRESLRRRKERAVAQKWALIQVGVVAYNERAAAAGMAPVTMAQAIKPGKGETFADWQRRRVMDAQIDELTIREFAKTLAGLDRETAEQTAYFAGWSNYEFARAWALRAIV